MVEMLCLFLGPFAIYGSWGVVFLETVGGRTGDCVDYGGEGYRVRKMRIRVRD
jgi:hypothetical protein